MWQWKVHQHEPGKSVLMEYFTLLVLIIYFLWCVNPYGAKMQWTRRQKTVERFLVSLVLCIQLVWHFISVFNCPQVVEARNCSSRSDKMKQIFIVRYYEVTAVTIFLWSWSKNAFLLCKCSLWVFPCLFFLYNELCFESTKCLSWLYRWNELVFFPALQ